MRGLTIEKRILDLAISIPAFAACTLLFLAIAVALRATRDRGPLFHRAARVGEGGRMITVLKLRTMRIGMGGPALTRHDDPRITSVGRVLRRTKLDELPQLLNVIRGDMSLVGPRPEDPAFVVWDDPAHAVVFRARPGITGLAQLIYADEERLHAGLDTDRRYRSEILPAKVRIDSWYLAHRTMRLDVRILVETLAVTWRRSRSGPMSAERLLLRVGAPSQLGEVPQEGHPDGDERGREDDDRGLAPPQGLAGSG